MNFELETLNFFRSPFFLPLLYPQLLWRIDTASKELYLTFDDGPVPGPTDFVLEELKKWNARATFFCIGDNVKKYPDVFKKVVGEGHAIGNHTFNHLSGWSTTRKHYLENVQKCNDVLSHSTLVTSDQYPVTGQRTLFRPPYGRITRNQIKLLTKFKIVMWDVLTHDYAKSLSPKRCLEGTIAATRPGSIIVFHDSLKAEKNMRYVLPLFMEHFTNHGYTFKSLR